jgi:hypothetical protein
MRIRKIAAALCMSMTLFGSAAYPAAAASIFDDVEVKTAMDAYTFCLIQEMHSPLISKMSASPELAIRTAIAACYDNSRSLVKAMTDLGAPLDIANDNVAKLNAGLRDPMIEALH